MPTQNQKKKILIVFLSLFLFFVLFYLHTLIRLTGKQATIIGFAKKTAPYYFT